MTFNIFCLLGGFLLGALFGPMLFGMLGIGTKGR